MESLEQRLVLAAVTWTGAADGASWNVADNWDLRRVPAGGDDVIIPDLAAIPTVQFATGSTSINSLTSFETFVLAGGSLSIDGTDVRSEFHGPVMQSGGVLGGRGIVTVAKSMDWTGGAMSGSGTTQVAAGASLNITGKPDKELNGRRLEIGGTAKWTDIGDVVFRGTTGSIQILTGGVFDVQNDEPIRPIDVNSSLVIDNAGIWSKAAGAGSSTVEASFTNSGTVEVHAGTLGFTKTYFQTAGATALVGGAFSSMQRVTIQGGVLGGAGTVAASVENFAGEAVPVGVLRIDGNYTQGPAGRLSVAIGGLTPGTGFDQLHVTGHAALDGTLGVQLKSNFVASGGDSFQILTFGSHFGDFPNTLGLDLGGVRVFEKTFGPNALSVVFKLPNAPPVAVNPIQDLTVPEDSPPVPGYADLNAVFQAPDLLHYSAVVDVGSDMVLAAVDPSGLLDLDFLPDRNGVARITVRATDPAGLFAETQFGVTLVPVNDSPTAEASPPGLTVLEDSPPVAITLNAADIETPPDQLEFTIVTAPKHGKLRHAGAVIESGFGFVGSPNQLTYQPAPDYNGPDGLQFQVTDLGDPGPCAPVDAACSQPLNSNVVAVSIAVKPVNDAPVAVADEYSIVEGTTLSAPAAGVLANDSDVDQDPLSAVFVQAPVNGVLKLNADGSFTYTPGPGFHGIDSFTYKANDGALDSNVADVVITVKAINTAPVATADAYVVDEDTALVVPARGVLANDTDADGDPLSAVLVSGPSHGTLGLNSDGSFSYTPGADFNGSDSFTYKANDGRVDSNVATVSIAVVAVNDPPRGAASPAALTIAEDALATAVTLTGTDLETPASKLRFLITTAPAHGALKKGSTPLAVGDSFIGSPSALTYRPLAGYNGPDSFQFVVSDQGDPDNCAGTQPACAAKLDSPVVTVPITVNPVNDPPLPGVTPASLTVAEDSAATSVTLTATDFETVPSKLRFTITAAPAHGTLKRGSTVLVSGSSFTGSPGSLTYQPALNYNGPDSFQFLVSDRGDPDNCTGSAPACSAKLFSPVVAVPITVAPVDDAPVAAADAYGVPEDSPLIVPAAGVLANDSDIDLGASGLSAVLVAGPAHGTLALNANGSFTYIPSRDFFGTDSFTYKANDGVLDSAVATVSITVNAVNDPPVASADAYSVAEDSSLAVPAPGVFSNDLDVDGPAAPGLSALLVSGPAHGGLRLNADGSFSLTPDANFNGADSFSYKANDGVLDSGVVTVSLTVTPVNDAPAAISDAFSVNEDGTLAISAPGVLGNDFDQDGDRLSAALAAGPAHGVLRLNADGSFSYMPDANFNGADSFSYKANDGSVDSGVATVSLTVNAVNDPPVAGADFYSVNEDGALIVSGAGVLANDSDIDDDPLAAALVAGPAHGSLRLNADGSFNYTPDANFNGADSFSYKANDGSVDSGVATVSITVNAVNDPPVAGADFYSVDEDRTLIVSGAGVLANDSDVDHDPLSAALVAGPAHGSLRLNADGSFNYTPDANFNGADSFSYRASDGSLSSGVATVGITVNAINDAPLAAADSFVVDEDGILVVTAAGVLANDSDIDPGAPGLSATLVAGPTHGTLVLNSDGSFVCRPFGDFHGSDGFTYEARDGAADSNVAAVSITVNPVNDAPAANSDSYSVLEDTSLVIVAPGVLGNDGDVDGDRLSAVLVSGPAHGSLRLNDDGSFTYTPDANVNGTDSFSYKASDGRADSSPAAVSIAVLPVNDPPAAIADFYRVDEDNVLAVAGAGVLANDSDVDGDTLSAVLATGPAHGTLILSADGSFRYTPAADFNGPDSFSYRSRDGQSDSNAATVLILVGVANDVPVAAADAYSVDEDSTLRVADAGVLANDSDVDGDALSAVLVRGPGHGTLVRSPDGSFAYTPDRDFNGADSFTYKASDGMLDSNVATVTIVVNPVNDPPVAAAESYSVTEDGRLTVAARGVLGNDTDVDGDRLSDILTSGPAHGSLSLNGDGSFIYTPAGDFNGTDSFNYSANDGDLRSGAATVSITVTSVNDAPVAAAENYTVQEDDTLTILAPGVVGNDFDVDGPGTLGLSAVLVSGTAHGSLRLNADGSFSYTPDANFNGLDGFTYGAGDGIEQSAAASVSISVIPVEDVPTAAADAFSVSEDGQLAIAAPGVLGNDLDVDGDRLLAVLVSDPAHGSLTLNADGSFVYTLAADFNGTDSFSYRATDGVQGSNAASVSIAVIGMNDAPVATSEAFHIQEDGRLAVPAPGVLGNDRDVDVPGPAGLSAILVSGPSHGSLLLNADGSFVYTPNANFNGSDWFAYKAGDGSLESASVTGTIVVQPVNDPPRAVATPAGVTIAEDTAAAVTLVVSDVETAATRLTLKLIAAPAHGTLTIGPTTLTAGSTLVGSPSEVVYQPAANYNGPDSVQFQVSDAGDPDNCRAAAPDCAAPASSAPVTVLITVTPVNDAPAAAPDAYRIDEDPAAPGLSVAAPGLLANDSDIDPAAPGLSAVLVAVPPHGTLTLNSNGSFVYTPFGNFHGTDSFTYKANDGGLDSGAATVSITVDPVNDAPIAAAETYSVQEDGTLSVPAPGVLGNDFDVDGDRLQAVLVSGPAHGAVAVNADGSFIYTPGANLNGADTFTYRASDGRLLSPVAAVAITVNPVNDAPVASADSYSVDEDQPLSIAGPGLLANDFDIEHDPLSAKLATGPSHGTLTLNPNGSFTYTPTSNYHGVDSFSYQASDGAAISNVAVVSVTIRPVNDAPVAAAETYTVDEDGRLMVPAPGLLANDADVDLVALGLSALLVSGPLHGSLGLNADGSFVYTPDGNFNGSDAFSYKVSDGSLDSSVVTVPITVNPINDAPVVTVEAYAGDEDTRLMTVAPGVLGNDRDVDGDPLSAVLLSAPAHGSFTLNADGSFSYSPAPNFNGTDTFTYKVTDGRLDSNVVAVTITVNSVNDVPVALADRYSVSEDPGAPGLAVPAPGVLGNDFDVDGDRLSAVLVSGVGPAQSPLHGSLTWRGDGSFVYIPDPEFNGVDTFTYTTTDGALESGSASVSITVRPVNDRPVAAAFPPSLTVAEDSPATIVTLAASDVESEPAHTIFQVLPDGSHRDERLLRIGAETNLTFRITDAPAHGTLRRGTTALGIGDTFAGNPSDVMFQPAADYNGPDSFQFQVIDGGDPDACSAASPACSAALVSDVVTVPITVYPVNDPPSFTSGSNQSVPKGIGPQTVADWATGISTGPGDDAGQQLAFTVSNDNNGLFAVQPAVSPAGTLSFTPTPGASGTTTVTVQLCDDGGTGNGGTNESTLRTFTITVAAADVELLEFTSGGAGALGQLQLKYRITGADVPALEFAFFASTDAHLSAGDQERGPRLVTGRAVDRTVGDHVVTFDGGPYARLLTDMAVPSVLAAADVGGAIPETNEANNDLNFIGIFHLPASPAPLVIRGRDNVDSVADDPNDLIVITGGPVVTLTTSFAAQPLTLRGADISAICVFGLGGNDSIRTDAALTQPLHVRAGSGDDTVVGGSGDDTIEGGVGDDNLQGGGGTDTVDYSDSATGVSVNLLRGAARGEGRDMLAAIENVIGSSSRDTLIGDNLSNLLLGGDAADVIRGGKGDDTLDGGAGNDYLSSDDGDDLLLGGSGNDVLCGGAGDDRLLGHAGDDSLSGGLGRDQLDGGAGFDKIWFDKFDPVPLLGGTGRDAGRLVLEGPSS